MQNLNFVELVILIVKKSLAKTKLIIATTVLFAGLGVMYSISQKPVYTAKLNLKSEHISYAESRNCLEIIDYYSQKGDYKSLSEFINYDQAVLSNIISCKVKNTLSTDNYSMKPPANLEATFKVRDTAIFKHLREIVETTFRTNPSISEEMKYSAQNLNNNMADLSKSVADLDSSIEAFNNMQSIGSNSIMVSIDNFVNQRMLFMYSINETRKKVNLLKPIVVVSELRSYNPIKKGFVMILGISFLGVVFGIGIIILQEVWSYVKRY